MGINKGDALAADGTASAKAGAGSDDDVTRGMVRNARNHSGYTSLACIAGACLELSGKGHSDM